MQKFVSDGRVLLLLLPLYKYKPKFMCHVNRRRTEREATEHDQGLEEENGPSDEYVNAMEVFRDFHTSRKNGLSDAARAIVVGTFF